MRQSCNGRMPDCAQHYIGRVWKQLPSKCHYASLNHPSGYSTKLPSYLCWNHTISCGKWYVVVVSFVRTLALFNHLIFFLSSPLSSSVLPEHTRLSCCTTPGSWITCTPFPSPRHMTPLFFSLLIKPLHMCAPFWLEIAECTVAPVAMEDSDHEVNSSSEEQDSCPASPNHSRDHEAEQVLLKPPGSPQI